MEKKHYTPEIEELHVGFICEVKDPNNVNPEWKHTILNKGDINGFFYYKTLSKNDIRVKYLDKEDIEECGWNFQYTEKGFGARSVFKMLWPKTHIHLCQNYKDDLYLSYPIESPTIVTIYNNGTYEDYEGVTLTIKNISELKKLMKQLNIE